MGFVEQGGPVGSASAPWEVSWRETYGEGKEQRESVGSFSVLDELFPRSVAVEITGEQLQGASAPHENDWRAMDLMDPKERRKILEGWKHGGPA